MLPESIRRRLASLDRWEVWAYSLWGVALLAVCCRTMIWPRIHSLYPIFALAAEHWRAGIDLYDKSGLDYYRYSPLVAALFVPFSLSRNHQLPASTHTPFLLTSISGQVRALSNFSLTIISSSPNPNQMRFNASKM